MKRSVLCVTTLVCLLLPVLAGCEPTQNPNVPKSYYEKEEHFWDGCQDFTHFCVYYYHLDEFEHNSRYEVIDRADVERVRGYFEAFRKWVQEPIERKAVSKNASANVGGEPVKKKPVKKAPKPGRNDPCPCGKMKADGSRRLKYKECCGRNE